MHVALLVLALQLRVIALSDAAQRMGPITLADSLRDLGRARRAQASFERSRRAYLPFSPGSGGRCDVRLGRFCWWYDEAVPKFPQEAEVIRRRRVELLATLDTLALRHPGDDWIAGMRVHYRIDGGQLLAADSTAVACRATPWWCAALVGYASHQRGDAVRADSAFSAALAQMNDETSCAWRNISAVLNDDDRDAYEHRPCAARRELEDRYWLLSRPQLASGANEWKNEFSVRRVLIRLAEHAATPHALSWGDDAAELVLRYGWPTAWSRVAAVGGSFSTPIIIGHDPSPSFTFAPAVKLSDSVRAVPPDAWTMNDPRGEARYAPRLVRRVVNAVAQIARFRRGDSTLVVAAFAAADDSLVVPVVALAVARLDGAPVSSAPDSNQPGIARVTIAGAPFLVGIELADTATATLARTRLAYLPAADGARLTLSDLLVYRAGEEPATSLDSALAHAIPGDTAFRDRPIGLFWETYGLAAEGETVDVEVSVERVDHGWIRSARQRLGLTPVDTPLKMRWTDARPAAGRAAGRAVSLDLTNLDAGRYRVTLTLRPPGSPPVSTTREIALLDG